MEAEELIFRLKSHSRALIRAYVSDPWLAEDVMQELAILYLQISRSYVLPPGDLLRLAATAARNKVIDIRRRQDNFPSKQKAMERLFNISPIETPEDVPFENAAVNEAVERIVQAASEDPFESDCVRVFLDGADSMSEVARRKGVDKSTVSRGFSRLRDRMAT